MRRWLCSLPWRLRVRCGYESALCADVMKAFEKEVVDHARIGWAHIAPPEVTDAERAAVARAFAAHHRRNAPPLVRRRSRRAAERPRLAAHEVERVVEEALTDLILPGFEQVDAAIGGSS